MMIKQATRRPGDQVTKGSIPLPLRRSVASSLRRGFSFPEVMFAVVILGIGFIMLAAIFPVAIKQSRATMNETRAMGIARSAIGTITGLADGSDAPDSDFYKWAFNQDPTRGISSTGQYYPWTGPRTTDPATDNLPLHVGNSLFPATGLDASASWFTAPLAAAYPPPPPNLSSAASNFPGRVFPVYTAKGWDALRGCLIDRNDTRYAWTFLYRRDGNPNYPPSTWSPVMQVYIIVANVRARTNFNTSPDGPDIGQFWNPWDGTQGRFDIIEPPTSCFSTANLYPRYVEVRVTNDYQGSGTGPGPDLLQLNGGSNPTTDGSVAEGCYVIMQGTNATGLRQQGKVYQLGPSVGKDEWEMVPGHDMQSNTEDTGSGKWEGAWVLGRERDFANATHSSFPKPTFPGPAQDIYLYTAVVPIGRN